MSSSSSGSDRWYCGFHFNRDANAWQRITAELNRLHWLVGSIHDLRLTYSNENWADTAKTAMFTLRQNQRSDLLPAQNEIGSEWIRRLDRALVEAIGKPPRPDQRQPGLIGVVPVADTFQRASFSAPEGQDA
jgi:hypothetical protein